ncbi:MAG TPA: hypothetical protein VHG30_01090 [Microvirga sp.]|nr:hypothetical protein [Microvirga sp.]
MRRLLGEVTMLNEMFDQAVRAGEAQREGGASALIPALMGCLECGTVEMIAAPVLGTCAACGAAFSVLRVDQI